MRCESPAPVRRRSGRPDMRRALAFSLAGHLCVALVLVDLGPLPSAPATPAASPVEVRVVDDDRLAAADLTTAHQPAGINAVEKTPRPRKPTTERTPSISTRPQHSPETSAPAPSIPQVAASTVEDGAAAPRILADGDIGVAVPVANPAASAATGKSGSRAPAFGKQGSGWSPGSPQWESLRAAIQRRVVYPDVARRMGWQGKVIVTFGLQKNGEVRDLRVLASSGFTTLDNNALRAVERAAPLPPAGEFVQIVMPIVFALR